MPPPKIVGFDIEATSLLPFHPESKLICASLADSSKVYTHVWDHPEKEKINEEANIRALYEITKNGQDQNVIFVGHNLGYDITFWEAFYKRQLKKPYQPVIKCQLFDTMIAQSLIDENADNKLEDLANRYTEYGKIDIDARRLWNYPIKDVVEYNRMDAIISRALYKPLYALLKENKLLPIFNELTQCLKNVIRIQVRGVNVDVPALKALYKKLNHLDKKYSKILVKFCGDINFNSPQQLGQVLFTDLKWPIYVHTAKGSPSTNAEALAKIKQYGKLDKTNLKILDTLLLRRANEKKLGTYVEPLMEKHLGWDGRVHSSYFLGRGSDDFHNSSFGTRTGRTSSRNPNLQNIANDLEIRALLIPTLGYRIYQADHSQLELRIAGFFSKDSAILQAFKDKKDIHTLTTAYVYDKPYEEVAKLVKSDPEWKERRRICKTFNFAMIYGAWWRKLQLILLQELGIEKSESEIKQIMSAWKSLYKEYEKWKKFVHQRVIAEGSVVSETGRTRHFFNPNIRHNFDWSETAEFERQGLNTIIQSFASDVTVIGWNHLVRAFDPIGAHVLMNVHDSLDGEYIPERISDEKLEKLIYSCLVDRTKETLVEKFNVNVEGLYLHAEIKTNCEVWS